MKTSYQNYNPGFAVNIFLGYMTVYTFHASQRRQRKDSYVFLIQLQNSKIQQRSTTMHTFRFQRHERINSAPQHSHVNIFICIFRCQ